VRELFDAKRYEAALNCVLGAFGIQATPAQPGELTENVWPPLTPELPACEDTATATELALTGVRCCNRQLAAIPPEVRGLALPMAATALRLCEGGADWRFRWRSHAKWAAARLQLMRHASKALRAENTTTSAAKSLDCLVVCERILALQPLCVGRSEVFQIHESLVSMHWFGFKNGSATMRSCVNALRVLGKKPDPKKRLTSPMFVLRVLHTAALKQMFWQDAHAAWCCAKYCFSQLQKRPDDVKFKYDKKCYDEMRRSLRKYSSAQPAPSSCSEGPHDIRWLLKELSNVASARDQEVDVQGVDEAIAELGQKDQPNAAASTEQHAPTDDEGDEEDEAPLKGMHELALLSAASRVRRVREGSPASTATTSSRPSRNRELRFCLLAIEAFMIGESFPIWKVAVSSRSRLGDVLRRWANSYLSRGRDEPLPASLRASAGAQGEQLQLDSPLWKIRSLLPVVDGRLLVSTFWPGSKVQVKNVVRVAGSGLGKLRISTRYANVDGAAAGYHSSSTHRAKLEAGVYDETMGQFSQAAYTEAMRTAPEPTDLDLTIATRELYVFPDDTMLGAPLFRALLRGPPALIANWEATCEKFETGDATQDKTMPYPVFIPSRGRADGGNLNWEAEHVFGLFPQAPAGSRAPLHPVVCVVVEPREEDDYRDAWPLALTLVLPTSGKGPGYARWVVQRVCARAFVVSDKSAMHGNRWLPRRFPHVWIADDGLTMFYRLVALKNKENAHANMIIREGAKRIKEREAPTGANMFKEAMLAVQRHAFLPSVAVAGFLRDDGTAVCKRLEWKADERSLYKIVLLNLIELRRLRVEYQPDLQMYEDIFLTHQVLRGGGRTLKCQSFCFRATHSSRGGCSNQRQLRGEVGTQIGDLMAPAALARLAEPSQVAVRELLEWVRSKERMSQKKTGCADPKDRTARREGAHSNVNGEKVKSAMDEAKRADKNAKRRETRDHVLEYIIVKKRRLEKKAAQEGAMMTEKSSLTFSLVRPSSHEPEEGRRSSSSSSSSGSSSGTECCCSSSAGDSDDEGGVVNGGAPHKAIDHGGKAEDEKMDQCRAE